jgi:excisionase family DNA binding protein
MQSTTSTNQRLAHSIVGALSIVPIGRSFLYEEIRAGRLKTFKVGRRTLIADADLRGWLDAYRRPDALAWAEGRLDPSVGGTSEADL